MIKKFFSLFSKCISCGLKDKTINRLENQLSNLRCDNNKYQTQYFEQKRKSDDLEKILDSRDLQLSNLRCDNNKYQTQHIEQKRKLDDLKKILDSREQELDKLRREVDKLNKNNKSPKKTIRKSFSKIKRNTDGSSNTNFTTCPVCRGDGGLNGGCFRCEGRGYLKPYEGAI